MAVKVETNGTYNEISTIIMENDRLRAVIMPELGAKLWQLHYKPAHTDLLWRNPNLNPHRVSQDSVYDDVFFGGWDELYPNDIDEIISGKKYPDHGEIWSVPWEWDLTKSSQTEATLHLWVETPISKSKVEKWITLRQDEAKLRFFHKITYSGANPLPFLWKLHAACRVDEHSRIDLPAESIYIEEFGQTRTGMSSYSYNWPFAKDHKGELHDMRRVPAATSGIAEFQYATEMKDGWCALTHTKERISFGIAYDRAVLPSCWLFATYGGWQNLNTVVLEPCTGYPVSVLDGVKNKTHQTLLPDQVLQCEVIASVSEGLTCVDHIDSDGNMKGQK